MAGSIWLPAILGTAAALGLQEPPVGSGPLAASSPVPSLVEPPSGSPRPGVAEQELGTNQRSAVPRGRYMLGLSAGPAVGVYQLPLQGAAALVFGVAPKRSVPAYLLIPLQLHFSQRTAGIIVPLGFQYDLRLPLKGLSIYPRISVGYAAFFTPIPATSTAPGLTLIGHLGALIPELGLKYALSPRWSLGGELFSLPIFFSRRDVAIQYRILLATAFQF